ncbi:MAG: hypothetical protein AABW45_02050 [Nanoarchaeota archaeon]
MTSKLIQKDIEHLNSIVTFLDYSKDILSQYLEQGILYNDENKRFREELKKNIVNAVEKIIYIAEKL